MCTRGLVTVPTEASVGGLYHSSTGTCAELSARPAKHNSESVLLAGAWCVEIFSFD